MPAALHPTVTVSLRRGRREKKNKKRTGKFLRFFPMEKMSPLITQCQQQQTPVFKHPTMSGEPKGNLKPPLPPPRTHASGTVDLDTSPSARQGRGQRLKAAGRRPQRWQGWQHPAVRKCLQQMPAAWLLLQGIIMHSLIRVSPTYPSLLLILPQTLALSRAGVTRGSCYFPGWPACMGISGRRMKDMASCGG